VTDRWERKKKRGEGLAKARRKELGRGFGEPVKKAYEQDWDPSAGRGCEKTWRLGWILLVEKRSWARMWRDTRNTKCFRWGIDCYMAKWDTSRCGIRGRRLERKKGPTTEEEGAAERRG